MKSRRFFRVFWLMCWLPFVLAVVAFGFQAFLNSAKPPQYIALGKVVAATPGRPFSSDPAEQKRLTAQTLEGEEVHRRALERARGLHPELKEIEVVIKATTSPGSWIAKVVAVGDEPAYTKVFLDAVIDETMALLSERTPPGYKWLEGDQVAVMERPAAALADYPSVFRGTLPSVALGFGLGLFMALVSAFIAAGAAKKEPAGV